MTLSNSSLHPHFDQPLLSRKSSGVFIVFIFLFLAFAALVLPGCIRHTVSLEGLEVTQSIQAMSLSNSLHNNSVPMIADKKTVVRAYFSTPRTFTLTSGQLQATHTAYPVGTTFSISSVNSTSVTISSGENGNLPVKRDNIAKSLNFELPTYLTLPGTLTLTLQRVAGTGIGSHAQQAAPGVRQRSPSAVRHP